MSCIDKLTRSVMILIRDIIFTLSQVMSDKLGRRREGREREGESLRPSFSSDCILTSSNGTICCLLYYK